MAADNGIPDELIDMCLAHAKKDQTIAAYLQPRRGGRTPPRRAAPVGNFICGTEPEAKVVSIASRKKQR
jgi:hypothetical protein